ncbi:MAG: hypothetical protein WC705_01435 [Candidatus Paceibacterota bacterium]|jgi:hypothetical protein
MILDIIWQILGFSWWIIAFLILFPLANSSWLAWRQELYKTEVKFVLLEIHIPREILRNPKGMEQILVQIHSLGNYPGNPKEYIWEGEVTNWFTMEMVSFGGEIHFYLRVIKKYKDVVEAAFFSYYPDVEITIPSEDYLNKIPTNMREVYSKDLDIWGTELVLGKDPAYPLKSYIDFESPVEEKEYDPISVLLEVLGKVKKGEIVGIQFVCYPMFPTSWVKIGESLIKELKEKTTGSAKETEGGAINISKQFTQRTPGEIGLIKAVEENTTFPAFKTIARLIYISPREILSQSISRGVTGAFNQYSALNLNYFFNNLAMVTRTQIWSKPYVFPKTRLEYKKQRILYNYRNPKPVPQTFIGKLTSSYLFNWNFSTKEFPINVRVLATLFHPPMHYVLTAPHINRLHSRKGGASAGLSIFGDKNELEKFDFKE